MTSTPTSREVRSQRLADAAARRATETEVRSRRAIMQLQNGGERVTFRAVAASAGVSESYLYAHEVLSAEIRRLSNAPRRAAIGPTLDQSTSESLRTKLTVAMARVRELEAALAKAESENVALRGELVDLRRRATRRAGRSDDDLE